MTFKHVKFEDSEVMRSLERVGVAKGIVKVAQPTKSIYELIGARPGPTGNLTEDIVVLCDRLRKEGFESQALDIEQKFMMFKKADSLYQTSKETGEDLVNAAHPDGSHDLEGVVGDATVETILDRHLAFLDVLERKPTGKLAAKDITNAIKYALGQANSNDAPQVIEYSDSDENTKVDNWFLASKYIKGLIVQLSEAERIYGASGDRQNLTVITNIKNMGTQLDLFPKSRDVNLYLSDPGAVNFIKTVINNEDGYKQPLSSIISSIDNVLKNITPRGFLGGAKEESPTITDTKRFLNIARAQAIGAIRAIEGNLKDKVQQSIVSERARQTSKAQSAQSDAAKRTFTEQQGKVKEYLDALYGAFQGFKQNTIKNYLNTIDGYLIKAARDMQVQSQDIAANQPFSMENYKKYHTYITSSKERFNELFTKIHDNKINELREYYSNLILFNNNIYQKYLTDLIGDGKINSYGQITNMPTNECFVADAQKFITGILKFDSNWNPVGKAETAAAAAAAAAAKKEKKKADDGVVSASANMINSVKMVLGQEKPYDLMTDEDKKLKQYTAAHHYLTMAYNSIDDVLNKCTTHNFSKPKEALGELKSLIEEVFKTDLKNWGLFNINNFEDIEKKAYTAYIAASPFFGKPTAAQQLFMGLIGKIKDLTAAAKNFMVGGPAIDAEIKKDMTVKWSKSPLNPDTKIDEFNKKIDEKIKEVNNLILTIQAKINVVQSEPQKKKLFERFNNNKGTGIKNWLDKQVNDLNNLKAILQNAGSTAQDKLKNIDIVENSFKEKISLINKVNNTAWIRESNLSNFKF